MKKTLLSVCLILYCLGMNYAQEKPEVNIENLTSRLDNLGTVPGSISEYFTSEELVILNNHFNGNREGAEEKPASDLKAILPTKSYTSSTNLGELYRFIGNPLGDFEVIGNSSLFEHAGAVDPNDPNSAYVFSSDDDLYHVDLTTGTYTLLGNIPGDWMGAEYSHATGVLYAISLDNNLYTIDTINVTASLVGSTGLSGIPAALAINGGSGAYMLDLADDNLYSINLNTGAASLIGPIGFDANFGQGMYWYPPTGEVYLMAFNNSIFDPEFRIVDTSIGQSTLISIIDIGQLTQYGWVSSEPFMPGPDPQIYDTWYLTFLQSTDLNDPFYIEEIVPGITPSITILEDLSFTGEGACNTFNGTFNFEEPNFLNAFGSLITTDIDCGFEVHNSFENDLFDFLSNLLWYEFSDDGNTLHLEHGLFGIATLTNGTSPNPQVYNTWYLSEMTVENGENTLVSDIFPPISPTMVINEDLYFTGESACNEYMGDFMYHGAGDFFTIHNFDTTLSLCDYDSHNDFDTQFYSYFGVNADVLYDVGGTGEEQYLILEFATGYNLIFQNVPLLSIDENEFVTFIMYPNPASEELFISSENHEIESVVIYSVLGKKVVESESIEGFIDISNLNEGIYFVEVSTSEGKSVQKLIKK